MSADYYDRTGAPITADGWVQEFKNNTIKSTKVGDVHVSTVYLGIDHGYGDGPPIIFETMVFGGAMDQLCKRYSTQEAAVADHDLVVAEVRVELEKDAALAEADLAIPPASADVAEKSGMDSASQLRFAAPVVAAAFRQFSDRLLEHRDYLRDLPTATTKHTRMAGLEEAASMARLRADELDGGAS